MLISLVWTWWTENYGFEKVLLQSFPSSEGLSMLQFQKPKRTSMEVPSYPRSQMTNETPRKDHLSLGRPVLRSLIRRSCWHWSFRRRESIAAYCTRSLHTLCLLKFSVAALLCRSDCWLGWRVCYSHTHKQVHGASIAVCTCGLYPHVDLRCACDTDAAFDRPIDRRSALVQQLVR